MNPLTAKSWNATIQRIASPYSRRVLRRAGVVSARSAVRLRLVPPRVSGSTWPLQEIANAVRPRIVHNQKRAQNSS